ncbi:conserved hypothetical protein [Leishmania mexicana MHOM/GT/2001/U1103]|uniref:Uncharacterized protein n=1 Tax=Leishmania mexicana (strain MHOM/GT/2001/U1103) TaxID=929439 RepID=E9AWU1_LEIMU|nr:conserved hypothetical protein [Leishmania mexicana MHOM/GT/2001/U1103]CBZ27427.1 conserved hypothetical protein [Leishmania mexicana MHOM/GT/2001/U1103]
MRKRHDLLEIHSVAARPHKRGGTETTREHHFPLYSHPMFRAALHNADAVQDAVEEQSDRVDPRALDAALENMVTQLMEQQLSQHEAGGDTPPTLAKKDLIVTESELLALLAEATHATPLSPYPQQPPSAFPPIRPEAVSALASAAAACSPPPPQGSFIPNQGYHATHPPLHSSGDAKRCVGPPPRTQASSFSGAASALGGDEPDELNVVSVDALQQVALGSRRDKDEQAAPRLQPLSESAASTTSGRPTAQHPPPTMSLYSLLPCLVASPGLTAASVLPATVSSSPSPSPSAVTFREMDRWPGTSSGPVAQQSVDAQQLHKVPDAVFAAMDVLMDGNSCCMRRRQRLVATNRNKAEALSLSPRCLPGSGGSASGGSCFAFGCGSKGASLNCMYVPVSQNTLPAPPPPRTAAEAKARRILEGQRRKQRLQDQQQHPVSNSSLLAGGGNTAPLSSSFAELRGATIRLPTEPLRWRHMDRSGSRIHGSTHVAPLPAASSVSRSSAVVVGTASTLPLTQEASPTFTLRGIAGESVYMQAISSASRFVNPLP